MILGVVQVLIGLLLAAVLVPMTVSVRRDRRRLEELQKQQNRKRWIA